MRAANISRTTIVVTRPRSRPTVGGADTSVGDVAVRERQAERAATRQVEAPPVEMWAKAAQANRNSRLVSTPQRWNCNDREFVSHAMGVARQQRSKQHHRGRTRIDNINDKETA
jgi:hypothetical protein